MDDPILLDGHKLHLHPGRVSQWLQADTWEKAKSLYPIYWEITTPAGGACNHRCTFCSVDAIGYKPGDLPDEVLAKRMREAARLGVKAVMFGGTGEPLLEKKIDLLVQAAHDAGLDVAFTTNGVLLDKLKNLHLCTWVKVSLNAGNPETYAKVHRTKLADWDRVWDNLRAAGKRKGKCSIGVQAVVIPENVFEMRGLANMCAQTPGIDYMTVKPYSQATFMLGSKYKNTQYEKWMPYLTTLREFENDEFRVVFRMESFLQESESHKYRRCLATPNFWVYTMADGRVFTCSAHLTDERFCIGNLKEQSFQDIWEGERRRKNWELMKSFDVKNCRLNCRMNKQNVFLSQFQKVKHINFI